jgi:predicted AAA+ superfamily ATPase
MAMKRISREAYMNKLISLRDKQIIKIVTGVRRCGKSTLMKMFQEYLLSVGVKAENVITINFEDFDNVELRDPRKLYAYIKESLAKDGMTYVFFDEIQHVKDFPDVVNSLFIKPNVDLYLTGSNAYMLSSEIATLISGRYVEISMLPLSFKEYVESTGNRNELARKYTEYVSNSSFPYTVELKDNAGLVNDYLSGIYNTIVLKDIVTRKKISDAMMLESVILFAFDNIGNVLSTKKIADTMTTVGRKIDVKTVEKYLQALQESFILYQVKRYNIKGRQLLKSMAKFYVVDVGLRRMLLGSRSVDVGHILENIVYLELIRRGNEVFVGKVYDMEVDFVAMDVSGTNYYQVAATVREEKTLERELKSLRALNDAYPKTLLTLDDDPEADYDGIRRRNVLDWLME